MDNRTERREAPTEPTLAETIDNAVRRIATSVSIAGLAIALAIYARPGPPSYQAFATDTGIARVNTRSGTVIGCERGRCMILLQRGQDLAPNPNRNPDSVSPPPAPQPSQKALPVPAEPSPKAAPSPAAAPAPARQ